MCLRYAPWEVKRTTALLIHYSVSMVVKTEGESCTVLELSSLEHLPSRATLELVTLSQPFVLQAWDMQCRGPVWVAEDALQGHRIRALTRSGFIVLHKC